VSAAENPEQREIPASLVKQLRERTGAGMMECKRALVESSGNLDDAVVLLRERGMAQAGKRADRATTEGLVGTIVRDGVGAIVGVGCETEPVSRNDEFQAFGERVLRAVHADGPDTVAGFEEERLELIGKLGENIVVVGAARFDSGGIVAAYVHPPANKIGVLVALEGGSEELARRLAMHISFAAPEWKTRDEVPSESIDAERQIFLNSDEVQSKPEAAREKIVDGMLAKRFYAASPGGVLVDQTWIHDSAKTVGQALADAGATVKTFERVSVAAS
jgi:elongation factor Ts